MIKIALDMMGGDNAPSSNVCGVIDFLTEDKNSIKLYLVGSEEKIKSQLLNVNKSILQKIEIINTTEIVDDQDRPSRIIKTKPDSSMNVSINLLKNKVVDAVVSAGNTGCLLASSFFNLGMIEGIKRPALFAVIPSENGNFLIEGKRSVTVNNEEQLMVLTGTIRPSDVNYNNTINSSLIADASITYSGEGVIADEQRAGWMMRVLSVIWPF